MTNTFYLEAISPVDGRYHQQVEKLKLYFSEFALIKSRVKVEIEYFIALCQMDLPQLRGISTELFDKLRQFETQFTIDDALQIKEIEKITNHDVKAVEYFLKTKMEILGLNEYKEFIHFGLTSQDINNTAIPLLLKSSLEETFYPYLDTLLKKIEISFQQWKDVPMLAKTHGQVASPTRLGKEIEVFLVRLKEQIQLLKNIPISAKFGGATGNFNAHFVSYPHIDWHQFANNFIAQNLKLKRSYPTTQIEHYDHLGAILDGLKRINIILIDFCRDIWQYISMGYFTQKIVSTEVGSSAMPHKVNPINFENAEGNLGVANALFSHISEKLPISRLQRDLTDSTVLRNLGVPFAHSYLAWQMIAKGWDKLECNEKIIFDELDNHWEVISEAIQTILRREKYPEPYEKLKELTRDNKCINKDLLHNFIENLDIQESIKIELKKITPKNYIGK